MSTSEEEEAKPSSWFEEMLSEMMTLCPSLDKEVHSHFDISTFTKFHFMKQAKMLNEKHNIHFEFHILNGMELIRAQNKEKEKSKKPSFSQDELGLIEELKTLYSTTFTDTSMVWDQFEKDFMKKGINCLILAKSEDNTKQCLIGGSTITPVPMFSVMNMLVIREGSDYTESDEDEDIDPLSEQFSWRRKGLGLFLMGTIQAFLYLHHKKTVRPCVLQVSKTNTGASSFYKKCGWNCIEVASPKANPFQKVQWNKEETKSIKR